MYLNVDVKRFENYFSSYGTAHLLKQVQHFFISSLLHCHENMKTDDKEHFILLFGICYDRKTSLLDKDVLSDVFAMARYFFQILNWCTMS